MSPGETRPNIERFSADVRPNLGEVLDQDVDLVSAVQRGAKSRGFRGPCGQIKSSGFDTSTANSTATSTARSSARPKPAYRINGLDEVPTRHERTCLRNDLRRVNPRGRRGSFRCRRDCPPGDRMTYGGFASGAGRMVASLLGARHHEGRSHRNSVAQQYGIHESSLRCNAGRRRSGSDQYSLSRRRNRRNAGRCGRGDRGNDQRR